METTNKKLYVMLCVVINTENDILLLKRAKNKMYSPNQWAVVGAMPLKGDENMKNIAEKEMRDELGIDGEILKEGREIVEIDNKGVEFHVYPFIARITTNMVILNKEHTDYKWVGSSELDKLDLAPGMDILFQRLDIKEFLKQI